MGLYLAVFADALDTELDGVDVGSYADFNAFRVLISEGLESGRPYGSRFPTLMLHADSRGAWTPAEVVRLRDELATILVEARRLPPVPWPAPWMADLAGELGLTPASLADSFIDADGQVLPMALLRLCDVAIEADRPIEFQ